MREEEGRNKCKLANFAQNNCSRKASEPAQIESLRPLSSFFVLFFYNARAARAI
jgi:hypothetical protein